MSDQQGLSIFDSANQPQGQQQAPRDPQGGGFPVTRRGYDTNAVDAYLRSRNNELHRAQGDAREARNRLSGLEQEIAELKKRITESDKPSYAGLGGRAAELLGLAEQQSNDMIARAKEQAASVRELAESESAAVRAHAAQEADDVRSVQLKEIEDHRDRLLSEAERERDLAKAEGDDIVAKSRRESEQVKLAATQEVATIKTGATREAEKIRASADRELAEARRVLALEKERLAKEAADSHAAAADQTGKLVGDAESRASAAEARAREAIAEATKHRDATRVESERVVARARREAEQILTTARSQSERAFKDAQADADRRLTKVRSDLDTLTTRRDAIVAQLAQLRDVVQSFGGFDLGSAISAAKVAPATEAVEDNTAGAVADPDPGTDQAPSVDEDSDATEFIEPVRQDLDDEGGSKDSASDETQVISRVDDTAGMPALSDDTDVIQPVLDQDETDDADRGERVGVSPRTAPRAPLGMSGPTAADYADDGDDEQRG